MERNVCAKDTVSEYEFFFLTNINPQVLCDSYSNESAWPVFPFPPTPCHFTGPLPVPGSGRSLGRAERGDVEEAEQF